MTEKYWIAALHFGEVMTEYAITVEILMSFLSRFSLGYKVVFMHG